jgi:DNA mismatch repair ATPase MutS
MIITGVNASGKTTYLKTTTINILLSQQFGMGFYKSGRICPFTYIHSYLNIPDTSGRDSLFQAESRRCKDIIDAIAKTSTRNSNNELLSEEGRHFVIFDELYSGTNPDEAVKSAVSLLKYLAKFSNVRFMLTTHYLKICKTFRKSDKISNYKMRVKVNENGNMQYLYTIKRGISKIQGGVEILKMMNYPEEILQDIRN